MPLVLTAGPPLTSEEEEELPLLPLLRSTLRRLIRVSSTRSTFRAFLPLLNPPTALVTSGECRWASAPARPTREHLEIVRAPREWRTAAVAEEEEKEEQEEEERQHLETLPPPQVSTLRFSSTAAEAEKQRAAASVAEEDETEEENDPRRTVSSGWRPQPRISSGAAMATGAERAWASSLVLFSALLFLPLVAETRTVSPGRAAATASASVGKQARARCLWRRREGEGEEDESSTPTTSSDSSCALPSSAKRRQVLLREKRSGRGSSEAMISSSRSSTRSRRCESRCGSESGSGRRWGGTR